MQVDDKEVLTVSMAYGKIRPFVDYGANRFMKEFDDVDEIEAVALLKLMFKNEIDKIKGAGELKELQEEEAELKRKIARVTANA